MPRHCELPGCGIATRAGKPFCSEHVEHHPYIADLIYQLNEREQEEARVREEGGGAIVVDGLTVGEILQFLRVHGDRSIPRLARDLNMDLETLELYVDALIERRLVAEREVRRKARMIGLPEAKPRRRTRRSKAAGATAEASEEAAGPRP